MRYYLHGGRHYVQNVGTYPKQGLPSFNYAKGNLQFERTPDGLWMWWITYSDDKLEGFYRGSAREVYKFVCGRLRAIGGRYFLAEQDKAQF
jgi:hypothetical protein